jgi:5-methylcytosine-specific restriction endonuclease McrA
LSLLNSIEQAIVDNLRALTHTEWKSSCAEAVSYRIALLKAQKWRCAYCERRIFRDEVGYRELDHVLPKSQRPKKNLDQIKATNNARAARRTTRGYPDFRYLPENLVVSCKRCNSYKGSYDGLANRSVAPATYPSASTDYEWIHPHFDVYRQHIERNNGLYSTVNRSPKGSAVIYACGLSKGEELTQRLIESIVLDAEEMTNTMLLLVLQEDSLDTLKISKALYKRFKKGSAVIIQECLEELHAVKAQGPEKLASAIMEIAEALDEDGPIVAPKN